MAVRRALLLGSVLALLHAEVAELPVEALAGDDECGGAEGGSCSVSALQLRASRRSAECAECSCCPDGCLDGEGKCRTGDEVAACFEGAEKGRAFTLCEEGRPVRLKVSLGAPAADACSKCEGGCATAADCEKAEDGSSLSITDCIMTALEAGGATFCGDSPQSIGIAKAEGPLLVSRTGRQKGRQADCSDCSCCADGCLDAQGKCQTEDVDKCFEGAEQGQPFTICTEEGPAKLKAKLGAATEGTCSACAGGCATADECQKPEDGSAVTVVDCIMSALDFDNATFCGDTPQFISIEEDGAGASLAQASEQAEGGKGRWGYGGGAAVWRRGYGGYGGGGAAVWRRGYGGYGGYGGGGGGAVWHHGYGGGWGAARWHHGYR